MAHKGLHVPLKLPRAADPNVNVPTAHTAKAISTEGLHGQSCPLEELFKVVLQGEMLIRNIKRVDRQGTDWPFLSPTLFFYPGLARWNFGRAKEPLGGSANGLGDHQDCFSSLLQLVLLLFACAQDLSILGSTGAHHGNIPQRDMNN
uniref:Uncharacterized protein n=1 Tax=Solanum tuberosum TaxID=4113 RepID=M1DA11_SOLTU